jgi:hypothetical protein
MAVPELGPMEIEDQVVGCVLDPGDLLDHDVLFKFQVGGIQAWMENQVRKDVERHRQVLVEHMGLITRVFTSRVGIEAPPEGLEGESDFMRGAALRSLEHEVLHQMAHTTRLGSLVSGTLLDPNAHRSRAYVGPSFGYNAYSVVE